MTKAATFKKRQRHKKMFLQVLANMVLCDVEFFRSKKNVPLEKLKLKPRHFCQAADLRSKDILNKRLIMKG